MFEVVITSLIFPFIVFWGILLNLRHVQAVIIHSSFNTGFLGTFRSWAVDWIVLTKLLHSYSVSVLLGNSYTEHTARKYLQYPFKLNACSTVNNKNNNN